ncbi:hypothetical protein KJ564_08740 [bacterium]|nr:hypothetical protein [bacterium]
MTFKRLLQVVKISVQGLPVCRELMGHPSMAKYIDGGYQVSLCDFGVY